MRLSERARALGAEIQIFPTSQGWTVRAFYVTDKYKFIQKRWTKLKEYPIADHRFDRLNIAVQEAIEWIDQQTKEDK